MPTLGNPTGTIEILKKYNFNFQKRFGQNFLIDSHILEKIVESAEIMKEDCVLEIWQKVPVRSLRLRLISP